MAKNSLRDQFKPTSVKSLKKNAEEDEKMLGISSNEYLQLEDKKTIKIRIFPAHPGMDAFYTRRKCYWLPFQKNDGEMGRTSVNDSVIHGGTKMDLVDEYLKAAKKYVGSDSEKLEALTGRDGLLPSYSWICYADKVQPDTELKAKLWEFRKSVRDALNRLAFTEDEDEAIETDPFTDIDEGLPVMVSYNKTPNRKKGENYYDVVFAKKPTPRPLTDSELEYFATLKPLNEVIGTYTIADFDRALAGLQIFDEENEIGLFDDDSWLEKVEEIRAQYDSSDEEPKKGKITKKVADEDDDDEEEKKPAKKTKKVTKVEDDEDEDEKSSEETDDDEDDDDSNDTDDASDSDDEFDDMERNDLKKYIKQNELDIVVKKSMSDDDIREAIRAAVSKNEDEEDADTDADDDDDDDDDDDEPKSKISLSEIRKKLGKK